MSKKYKNIILSILMPGLRAATSVCVITSENASFTGKSWHCLAVDF